MRKLWWLAAAGLATGGMLGCEERAEDAFWGEDIADPDRIDSLDENETDRRGIGGSGTAGDARGREESSLDQVTE